MGSIRVYGYTLFHEACFNAIEGGRDWRRPSKADLDKAKEVAERVSREHDELERKCISAYADYICARSNNRGASRPWTLAAAMLVIGAIASSAFWL